MIVLFTCVSLHFIQPVRDQAFSALERLMCLCVCYWKKPLNDPLRTCSVTVTLMFTVGRGRWRELPRERLQGAGEESSHSLAQISWSDTVQNFQRLVRLNQSFITKHCAYSVAAELFRVSAEHHGAAVEFFFWTYLTSLQDSIVVQAAFVEFQLDDF